MVTGNLQLCLCDGVDWRFVFQVRFLLAIPVHQGGVCLSMSLCYYTMLIQVTPKRRKKEVQTDKQGNLELDAELILMLLSGEVIGQHRLLLGVQLIQLCNNKSLS